MSSVYVSVEFVREYVCEDAAGQLPDDDAEVEALIAFGELAVDRIMSARLTPSATTGRKLAPAGLNPAQTVALERATAAAVEEIVLQGLDTLAELDDGVSLSGSLQFDRRPARSPGPHVREELAGFGLPVRSGTVAPPPEPEDGLVA